MVLFFFVIGLEVRREISIGELTDRRRLVVPTLGAVAGLLVPAALFLAFNPSGDAAQRLGRRDRHRHRVRPGRAGPRRPVLPDAAAGLPADPVDRRRRPRGERHRHLLLGLDRPLGRPRPPCSARGAEPAGALRHLAGVGLPPRGVALWLATMESGVHPTHRRHGGGRSSPPTRRGATWSSGPPPASARFRQSPLASVGRSASCRVARAVSPNERLQECSTRGRAS